VEEAAFERRAGVAEAEAENTAVRQGRDQLALALALLSLPRTAL